MIILPLVSVQRLTLNNNYSTAQGRPSLASPPQSGAGSLALSPTSWNPYLKKLDVIKVIEKHVISCHSKINKQNILHISVNSDIAYVEN